MAAMMKAAPQTTTYNSCVTTKNLTTNPLANGSGDNCTWTALNSTSTDMEVKAIGCEFDRHSGMTADVHGQVDQRKLPIPMKNFATVQLGRRGIELADFTSG